MRGIFKLIWVALSLYLTAVDASPAASVQRRACSTSSDPSCDFLLQRCAANPGFWNSNDCVAAATCSSVATVFEAVSCASPADPKSQPSLDYKLYAAIVGDCAWAQGGCPITPQNYADFYYRTLSDASSQVFPDLNDVTGWWNVISSWANTGSSVPYTNFNDWLHYSSGGGTSGGAGGGGSGGGGGGSGGGGGGGGGGVVGGGGGGSTTTTSETPTPTDCNYDEPDTFFKRTIDISNQTDPSLINLTRRTAYLYPIDCNVYPNVCENQCYYVYCKSGDWLVHVQRNPASRRNSECGGYNRCSHGRKCGPPPGGWDINPQPDWSCDEQPKSSTYEGGSGSATRCMPRDENSAEGSRWGTYINGGTADTAYVRLTDGQAVTVVLRNVNKNGYCASYGGSVGVTQCGSAASPPGTNDDSRQR